VHEQGDPLNQLHWFVGDLPNGCITISNYSVYDVKHATTIVEKKQLKHYPWNIQNSYKNHTKLQTSYFPQAKKKNPSV
jgi:hypothetical protein